MKGREILFSFSNSDHQAVSNCQQQLVVSQRKVFMRKFSVTLKLLYISAVMRKEDKASTQLIYIEIVLKGAKPNGLL